MKYCSALATLFFLICPPLLQADEVTHRQAAEDLLQAMHADQMMANIQNQQKEAIGRMMASFMPKNLTPEMAASMQQMQTKIFDYVYEEMSWTKLKPDFVQIYLEVFPEDEMKELIAFYQTPLGQKLLAKTPLIASKTMEVTQKRVMTMLPQIQKMAVESMQAAKPAGVPKAP